MLLCTTIFQIVSGEHSVLRKFSSNRTGDSQNCVSPEKMKIAPYQEDESMTRIATEQIAADSVPEQEDKNTRFQSVEIMDQVFEEPYTAHQIKKSVGWRGWIPDIPEVVCEAKTKTELLKTLAVKLREALEAREDAWDKQLEENIKAGKLDYLRDEALEEIKAGRVIDL